MLTRCPTQRSPRSQRQRRPQLSLLQRLWSLPQSLRRRLRRLLCPRRPPSEEAARPAARTSPNPRKVCRHRPGPPPPERQEPPKAEPPQTAPAPEPVEPVRMTPAQERALRYMQRADRFLELLTRNTHEV